MENAENPRKSRLNKQIISIMKKIMYVIAMALCLMACEKNSEGGSSTKGDYVDLGLTSGTKWKTANEMNPNDENGFYDYDLAMSLFEKNMPSKEQWMELVNECTWTWTGMGYRVTGVNNKSIVLPAAGYRVCDGIVYFVGSHGYYWSSTPDGPENAWSLYFNSGKVDMNDGSRCSGRSVRLVR